MPVSLLFPEDRQRDQDSRTQPPVSTSEEDGEAVGLGPSDVPPTSMPAPPAPSPTHAHMDCSAPRRLWQPEQLP